VGLPGKRKNPLFNLPLAMGFLFSLKKGNANGTQNENALKK